MQVWPKNILVDAGPLIALGRKSDKHHGRALAFAATCQSRMISSWVVVAEAAHFLDSRQRVNIYRMLEDGFLHLEDVRDSDATRLIEITQKYPQADLADATLVVLAERLGLTDIATLDKTDFAVYRTKTGKHFNNFF